MGFPELALLWLVKFIRIEYLKAFYLPQYINISIAIVTKPAFYLSTMGYQGVQFSSIQFNSLFPSIERILNRYYIQQFKTISEQVRTSHYICCNAEYAFKNVCMLYR